MEDNELDKTVEFDADFIAKLREAEESAEPRTTDVDVDKMVAEIMAERGLYSDDDIANFALGDLGIEPDSVDSAPADETLRFSPEQIAEVIELRKATEAEPEGEADEDSEDVQREKRLDVLDWVQNIVSVLIIIILGFILIGRHIGIDGGSMMNTLHHQDQVFVTNIFYEPKQLDIIILHSDAYGDTPLVKRVIATEGQTVDIDFAAHTVTVDGIVLDEPYIREPTARAIDFSGPVTVPEGYVFVLGDNRNASSDSRDSNIGFVDKRYILGKVHIVIVPGKNEFEGRDWSRFGSVYGTTPKAAR